MPLRHLENNSACVVDERRPTAQTGEQTSNDLRFLQVRGGSAIRQL